MTPKIICFKHPHTGTCWLMTPHPSGQRYLCPPWDGRLINLPITTIAKALALPRGQAYDLVSKALQSPRITAPTISKPYCYS